MGIIGTGANGQTIDISPVGGIGVGTFNRKIITWTIPNQGQVQMYINPQSIQTQERKLTKETRTKGGYMVQYWGNALPEIKIQGTTGSGGIEGINVLYDIYNQEQTGFLSVLNSVNNGFLNNVFSAFTSSLANFSVASAINAGNSFGITQPALQAIASGSGQSNSSSFLNGVAALTGNVANVVESAINSISSLGGSPQLIPTLAALALSVEMNYDGQIMRGYFKDFSVNERAETQGVFDYTMTFMVTRRSGRRHNDMPWQRSVNFGPADASVIPLSYGALEVSGGNSQQQITQQQTGTPNQGISRRNQITGG